MNNFTEIKGQSRAVSFFKKTLANNRLGHAYLFSGPGGVGKRTFARLLANLLLCTDARETTPCGRCGGCRKFLSGNHPDFIRIVPDGAAIKINQLRKLKEVVSFTPFEGGYRVILLEEVHTMRREAGNSLLKLLEEPPRNNIFVLVGASLSAMLPTIISRCQGVGFSPLPLEEAAAVIMEHQPDLAPAEASLLSALSDGCPGQALALDTEGIFALYTSCCHALVESGKGEASQTERALSLAAEISELKDGLPQLFRLLRIFFKNAMVATIQPESSQTFAGEISRARELWNLEQLSAKIAAVDFAEQAINRNCSRGLTCEVLLLDLFEGNLS